VLGDAPKFEGPYIIIDKAPHNVYKLQHFHTWKILRSYVHADKLKSCASARETRCQDSPRHGADAGADSSRMDHETSNDSPEYGGGGEAGGAYSGGRTPYCARGTGSGSGQTAHTGMTGTSTTANTKSAPYLNTRKIRKAGTAK